MSQKGAAPTHDEAAAVVSELLEQMGDGASAVLEVLMQGRKIAGPLLPSDGDFPNVWVRSSLFGDLSAMAPATEGFTWRLWASALGRPESSGETVTGEAPTWLEARTQMDRALLDLGWFLMTRRQPETRLPDQSELTTILQEPVRVNVAGEGSEKTIGIDAPVRGGSTFKVSIPIKVWESEGIDAVYTFLAQLVVQLRTHSPPSEAECPSWWTTCGGRIHLPENPEDYAWQFERG